MPSERAHRWLCAGAYRLKACVHEEYFQDLSSACCSRYEFKNFENEVEAQVQPSALVKPQVAELIAKDVPRSWSGKEEYNGSTHIHDTSQGYQSMTLHS